MIAEPPEWQERGLPQYGALLNEANEDLFLFRYISLDIVGMAAAGVVFPIDNNGSFSQTLCVDDFDAHAMGWRKTHLIGSSWNLLP